MGHSAGYRSGTRYMFKRQFGQQGRLPLTQYLRSVKVRRAPAKRFKGKWLA
jgi:ribosomal protein L21E